MMRGTSLEFKSFLKGFWCEKYYIFAGVKNLGREKFIG